MWENAIRTAVLGLVCVFCSLLLKKDSPVFSLLLTAALGMVILTLAVKELTDLRDFAGELAELAGIPAGVLSPLMKTLAIALVTRCSADLARDAGSPAAASYLELGGRAAALCAALPLLRTVVGLLRSLCGG